MFSTHHHFLCRTPTIIGCSAARVRNRSTEKQLAQHLAWDQGAQHICPLVSHGRHSEVSRGLPKGSVWLGDIWLSLVLRNPQPSPSARRPRCAEPASLRLIPTPLELCHSRLFNLVTVPSLVPITRHARVQISCMNNCGSPFQIGSTEAGKEGPVKLRPWMWEGRCRGIVVPGVC